MQINNNFSAITRQMTTRTPPSSSPTTAPTTAPTQTAPVQRTSSQRMQEYIGKSSKSSADVRALTGNAVIDDLKSRASSMGAKQVNSNSKGVGDWLKQSSLYKFFSRSSGESQDSGQVTKLGEAVNDATGTFSEIVNKGSDDVLKVGEKGKEDLQKTTDALKGKDVKLNEDDLKVKDVDYANTAVGVTTAAVSFFKAGYDLKEGASKWSESSELTIQAREHEDKAVTSQKLSVDLTNIGSANLASIQTTPSGGTATVSNQQIDTLVNSVKSTLNLSNTDADALKVAITAKATNTPPLTQAHTDLLRMTSGKLARNVITLMDQARVMKNDAKVGRREAALEMAKSVSTLTEKGANITARILEVADKSGVGHLANAAAVFGIASTVTSTVEMAVHIRSALKASDVKDAMKALRHPSKENFKKAAIALEEKASNLEAKAAKLTKPQDVDKKTALQEQAKSLRETANTLSTASPQDIEATKMQSLKLDASAKQIEKRQGVGSKILNACISALKVGAGIAATVAVFAGAVALAATPVGWALGAVALVGGVALGCYKAHQAYSRWKQNDQLATMHTEVKDKIANALPNQGGPATYLQKSTLQQELDAYKLTPSPDTNKTNRMQGQIDQMGNILTLKEDVDGDGLLQPGLKIEVQTAEREFNTKHNVFVQAQQEVERLSQGPMLTMPTGGSVSPLDSARSQLATAQSEMEGAQTTLSGLKTNLVSKQTELKQAESKFQEDYPSPDDLKALSKDISVMRCRKDPNFAADQIITNIKLDPTTVSNPADRKKLEGKQLESESLVEALGLDPAKFKQLAITNPAEAKKKLTEYLSPS